jgi:hypothetical protein
LERLSCKNADYERNKTLVIPGWAVLELKNFCLHVSMNNANPSTPLKNLKSSKPRRRRTGSVLQEMAIFLLKIALGLLTVFFLVLALARLRRHFKEKSKKFLQVHYTTYPTPQIISMDTENKDKDVEKDVSNIVFH